MWILHIEEAFRHLSNINSYLPAVVITVGAAVLVGCAASCVCSPCKEKDELFHRRVF